MQPNPTSLAGGTLIVLAAWLLAGCIAVPIPVAEKKVLSGSPVGAAQLAFLEPGRTTREETLKRLGAPALVWEDARISVYPWDTRQGVLLWAAGGYASAGSGAADIPRHHLLLLEFDADGRLVRSEQEVRPWTKSLSGFLRDWRGDPGPAAVDAPSPTMVLLRIVCTVDGKPVESFFGNATAFGRPLVFIGLGDFDSAGEPRVAKVQFLSPASRREGWTFLTLPAGSYYLSVFWPVSKPSGPEGGMWSGPRWRLVVPPSPVPLYAGSLRFPGRDEGRTLMADRNIVPEARDKVEIVDESERVAELLSTHGHGTTVKPVVLERWQPGDTVIVTSGVAPVR